jgi:hypothetical protein
MRNVLNQISHLPRPPAILMDLSMAIEAHGQTVLEVIESLADPAALVVHLGRQFVTNLTLEVLPQELQPQAAVFSQAALPYAAYRPEAFLASLQGASFH